MPRHAARASQPTTHSTMPSSADGWCLGTVLAPPLHVASLLSEVWLRAAVGLLVRLVEAGGAVVIFAGSSVGFVRFVAALVRRKHSMDFPTIRLGLGRFLALGLEFQLASDLLRTAVAPSFEEIGKLAAVAAIRTALNFFLNREMKEERAAERPGPGP